MESSLLVVEAPALRGAVEKLFGKPAISIVATDYERVAALGGNVEEGLVREQGVRFNPRIARVSLLALEEGRLRELSTLRAVVWSTLRDVGALEELPDADIRRMVACVLSDEARVEEPVSTIRAAIALDTVRHLHMTVLDRADKLSYIRSRSMSDLLRDGSLIPSNLKVKLQYAVMMQERMLTSSAQGDPDD